ncbi:CATRA system-associated protein [Streptomyces sp. RKAG293]|uniref:CATRA system-associated protein n=1 Tax=Streptomyces sp. RKAG293 TaxID=2893403 RepID=UPI002033E409|nr:CATRA system-associated protein [Streptomyces sp. RKAG293]MCM2422176.1 hypothetical protein [Streptomyces sp. RKAG293]
MSASIRWDLAQEVQLALNVMLDWRLPPDAWDETGRLLSALGEAVDAGDAMTVDELTADLETSGWRARRIGAAPQNPPPDGKVPAPQPVRERAVALLHALERSTAAGRDGTDSAAGGGQPSGR